MERFELFSVRMGRNNTTKVETDSFEFLFSVAQSHAMMDDEGLATIYPEGSHRSLACVFKDGQVRHYES